MLVFLRIAELAIGTSPAKRNDELERIKSFRPGVAAINLVVRLPYGARQTDEATSYKAFRTELLRDMDLRCHHFEFCPEVTAKACRLGLNILEVPISYDPRTVRQGKKIRWRDGVEVLTTLWRLRKWTPPGAATAAARARAILV